MHCLTFSPDTRHDASFDETLLLQAIQEGDTAVVWQAHQSLVVPRTYRRFAEFDAACARSAELGWPVIVRQSGGGIVPQGGGILNFSFARIIEGRPLDQSDTVYLALCRIVADALRAFGIDSVATAVPGSFCDGRFNVAVDGASGPRKIAGTAQLWRRIAPQGGTKAVQVVLAHAVILADVDTRLVTARINDFETALGSTIRYLPERVVALRDLLPAGPPPGGYLPQLERALADAVQHPSGMQIPLQ